MSIYLKSTLVSLILGCFCIWGFYVWRQNSAPTNAVNNLSFMESLEKDGLPNFHLKTIDGRVFDSSEHQGKVILVNFWASWCTPCLEEVPSMLKLVQALKGKMVLLAVSQDSQVSDIEAFLKAFPQAKDPNVYIVWDEHLALGGQFRVNRLPESYLSNGRHKLAKKIIGSIEWFNPESVRYVEGLVEK